MTPPRAFFYVSLTALLASGFAGHGAHAASSGWYSMDILVQGDLATEYTHGGKTYIEARKGTEYAIRLTNHTGSRVAVALSVDGLNTIDARHTTAYDGSKWLLDPYATLIIRGWQTSSQTARRFFFTTESDAYGAWLGKTRNLGNITAAFFPEKNAPPPYRDVPLDGVGNTLGGGWNGPRPEQAQAPGESTPDQLVTHDKARSPRCSSSPRTDDRFAATGIGRETQHRVTLVAFEHTRTPAAVLTIRYEFRDALVKLGVLPKPWVLNPYTRRETSSGFASEGFAPDPHRER